MFHVHFKFFTAKHENRQCSNLKKVQDISYINIGKIHLQSRCYRRQLKKLNLLLLGVDVVLIWYKIMHTKVNHENKYGPFVDFFSSFINLN